MRVISRTFRVWLALSICLAAGGMMAQVVDSVQYIRRVDRLKYISFVPAKQRCENWAVASVLQSTLEMEGVSLPQEQLVLKLSGNDTCRPNLKAPAELVGIINKVDYKSSDGAPSVHVQAKLDETSVDPGRLISLIRQNRPFLWIWNGHVYMAVGINYVDAVHASGSHEYDIQQIELMDPFVGAEQRPAIFQKTPISLAQVRGIIEITVSR